MYTLKITDENTVITTVNLSAMIAEDITGKDPDGVQDGVVNLDEVKEIQMLDLDALVK